MPKKRNRTATSTNSSPRRGWNLVKSGGAAFKDHSVPVNTKSRNVRNTSP